MKGLVRFWNRERSDRIYGIDKIGIGESRGGHVRLIGTPCESRTKILESSRSFSVIPAQAGIHTPAIVRFAMWIPVFARMTRRLVALKSRTFGWHQNPEWRRTRQFLDPTRSTAWSVDPAGNVPAVVNLGHSASKPPRRNTWGVAGHSVANVYRLSPQKTRPLIRETIDAG